MIERFYSFSVALNDRTVQNVEEKINPVTFKAFCSVA